MKVSQKQPSHSFWVIVRKEVSDHLHSWRFVILLGIITLTCIGSLYTAMSNIQTAITAEGDVDSLFFLRLFTVTDGTLPSFITFVSFLGPLLGIGLGFDAINSERNKGTLSRIMSQPIYRDDLLNAKFTASMLVISAMFFALTFLVIGLGLILIGIPPSPEEFWRIVFFQVVIIFYIGFWLNLSIFFSVRFRQPATSALSSMSIWLFFSIFYQMIISLVAKAIVPATEAGIQSITKFQDTIQFLLRLSPSQLFNEATTALLVPSVRSLSPITTEQYYGYIPSPLPFGQSLLLVWPQVTGLIAATMICFALSYLLFMRQEIRSRS